MKRAVRFVTAARALQRHMLGDNLYDIQPALDVVDNSQFTPCLLSGRPSCVPIPRVTHPPRLSDKLLLASLLPLEELSAENI